MMSLMKGLTGLVKPISSTKTNLISYLLLATNKEESNLGQLLGGIESSKETTKSLVNTY